MKIYTRTGDAGQTGLFGGARVKKDDPRVEAYGTIDELNACLGLANSQHLPDQLTGTLRQLQGELFVLGAEVACEPGKLDRLKMALIEQSHIDRLEAWIDEHEAELEPLRSFILPSGSPAGSALHLARTVARRAERRCLPLDDLHPIVLIYLNRLSDLLFVLARRANQMSGQSETPWLPQHEP